MKSERATKGDFLPGFIFPHREDNAVPALARCHCYRTHWYLMITQVSGRPLSWESYEAADGRHPIFHTLPGARGTAFFGWQVCVSQCVGVGVGMCVWVRGFGSEGPTRVHAPSSVQLLSHERFHSAPPPVAACSSSLTQPPPLPSLPPTLPPFDTFRAPDAWTERYHPCLAACLLAWTGAPCRFVG